MKTLLGVIALFSWMAGDWVGKGETTFPATGSKTILTAQVRSSVENGHLLSRNQLTATPLDGVGNPGKSATYDRVYCIRPRSDQDPASAKYFVFIYGDCVSADGSELDDTHAASVGQLNDRTLEVEQKLGPDYVIHSKTEFFVDGTSTYSETSFIQNTINSVTTITYRPTNQ